MLLCPKFLTKASSGEVYFGTGFQEKQSIMEGVMVTFDCYPNTTWNHLVEFY